MKANTRVVIIIIPLAVIVLGFVYNGLLFIAHKGDPHLLQIEQCLDSGGRWVYQENKCEYVLI